MGSAHKRPVLSPCAWSTIEVTTRKLMARVPFKLKRGGLSMSIFSVNTQEIEDGLSDLLRLNPPGGNLVWSYRTTPVFPAQWPLVRGE